MNSKIYLLVLSSLFFLGCSKKQKDGVIGKDPVEILNKAFMQSGDVAAWSENQAIKFGFSKIVFQAEGGQSDFSQLHQYDFGDRPKKRVSFEDSEGRLITWAEIQGDYFKFVNQVEDTLFNKGEVAAWLDEVYLVSGLPFSINTLDGQLRYIGEDSIVHKQQTDVLAISMEDQRRFWFYIDQNSGKLLSFKAMTNGTTKHYLLEAQQETAGFVLPVYLKVYEQTGEQERLIEEWYIGARTIE